MATDVRQGPAGGGVTGVSFTPPAPQQQQQGLGTSQNPAYPGAGPGGTFNNPVPGSALWWAYGAAAGAANPGANPGGTTPGKDVGAILAAPIPGADGSTPSPGNAAPAPMPSSSGASPPTNPGSTALSFGQVENFWIQAGGSPQAASMAAAVADAESGLNAGAQRTNPDGSVGVGLWLIPQNGTPPGSTDPLANARAAVQLSQGGTDWSQWCSTWSDNNCGQNNGTYLGQGSNALMSLAGQKPGAAYNVFGSAPSGSGVGASSVTSGLTGSTPSSGGSSKILLIVGLVIGVVLIWYLVNRKKSGKDSVSAAQ